MEVWIVERRMDYEDCSYPAAVFDSKEKADKYAEEANKQTVSSWYFKVDGPHEVK